MIVARRAPLRGRDARAILLAMQPGRLFQRRIEDFECGHCGEPVTGDGYTNHCPACLTSRHVDVHPGDRANSCGALMFPVAARRDGKKGLMLRHRCQACGEERWQKASAKDDVDEIARLL